jgi:hypothetical protein
MVFGDLTGFIPSSKGMVERRGQPAITCYAPVQAQFFLAGKLCQSELGIVEMDTNEP